MSMKMKMKKNMKAQFGTSKQMSSTSMTLQQKNRGYLIDATEHFYTEARKWKTKYEELAAKKSTKSTRHKEGTAEIKARLLAEGLAFGRNKRKVKRMQQPHKFSNDLIPELSRYLYKHKKSAKKGSS